MSSALLSDFDFSGPLIDLAPHVEATGQHDWPGPLAARHHARCQQLHRACSRAVGVVPRAACRARRREPPRRPFMTAEVALVATGRADGTRTHTGTDLNRVPLPIGLRPQIALGIRFLRHRIACARSSCARWRPRKLGRLRIALGIRLLRHRIACADPPVLDGGLASSADQDRAEHPAPSSPDCLRPVLLCSMAASQARPTQDRAEQSGSSVAGLPAPRPPVLDGGLASSADWDRAEHPAPPSPDCLRPIFLCSMAASQARPTSAISLPDPVP